MQQPWPCVRPQEDGSLALLDWGQCKALTAGRQRALARLVVALDRGWSLGIVHAMAGMGLSFLAKARPYPTHMLTVHDVCDTACSCTRTECPCVFLVFDVPSLPAC